MAKVLWSSSNSMALICLTNISQDISYIVSKKDMTDKSSENKLRYLPESTALELFLPTPISFIFL